MWKKVVGYTLLGVVGVAVAGFAYLYFRRPESAPALGLRVDMSPARVARGQYIWKLSSCDGCHSQHDESKQYLPVVESSRGRGNIIPEAGLTIHVPNITPDPETGIGSWSDGEKIRAIREGIGKDGNALFPMMPYQELRHLSDDDVQSLVAYMNTLAPVRHPVQRTEWPFIAVLMTRGVPRPVTAPVATPSPDSGHAYGEYLASVGLCGVCHTPFERGRLDMGRQYAGSRVFQFGKFKVVSANITPDRGTGIGEWSLEYFKERFQRHRGVKAEALRTVSKENFTVMGWLEFADLPDRDLEALYNYLRSRPPVVNKVATHPEL